jgi:hypothetical protein
MRFTWCFMLGAYLVELPALASEPTTSLPYSAWRGERVPPPPPQFDEGPPPLARAPVHARRPVEIVPEATLGLSLCEGGDGSERCDALGPELGGGVSALYRATPYFAFGGGVEYTRSGGKLAGAGDLSATHVGLGLLSRVYLMEEGVVDPYLELSLGWSSWRTALTTYDGARLEDGAFGPSARAGGGIDFVPFDTLKLGFAVGWRELVFGSGERCASGRCRAGGLQGGATHGALIAGLRVSLLFGDPL